MTRRSRWPERTPVGRFLAYVEREPGEDACWRWRGALTGAGYGSFKAADGRTTLLAHRYGYELLVGPIPDGLDLHHRCGVRSCVRPDHLQPIAHAEHALLDGAAAHQVAKTACPAGHPYDEANTIIRGDGSRQCRACKQERDRRRLHTREALAWWLAVDADEAGS